MQIRNNLGQFLKGYNGLVGFKHSEKTKEKMSKVFKGRKFSKETLKKLEKYWFKKGHPSYWNEKSKEKARIRMTGEKNPAKRLEIREKISRNRKGKRGRYGFQQSEETKRKISKSHKGKKKPWAGKFITEKGREVLRARRGSKSSGWKGGISSLYVRVRNNSKYSQWRFNIFTRDNFICVLCSEKGYIEADHYPKMRSTIFHEYKIKTLEQALDCEELWDINNGRTLCRKCHDKTKYGRPKKL